MKRFLLPLLLLFASPAIADTCLVTSGTPTTVAGQQANQYCDQNGNLRTTATITATGGTSSNAADAQATSTDNAKTISFPFLYNGTTWDRWRGDATSGAWVNIKNASIPVTGTFWQATQPVSIASMPSTPVTGTFWQATQPVSLSSLPALATGSNIIGGVTQSGTWNVGLTGTLPGFASTPTVNIGTAPTVTVTQGTAANLKVDISGTAANATAIKVDPSAVTSPVSLASVPSHAVTNAGTFAVQTTAVPTGTGGFTGSLSVGVASAQLAAAAARTARLAIKNESTTATIAICLGSCTAALNTSGNMTLGPGQMITLSDAAYVPGDAVNAIASAASTPATVWSK